ncbi:ankyrin repeat domain-containing protein 23-like [Amphibalanus amphitrite]|uniref:ankyrin repeat domain-containing protein 23-like n=1 Tax=Amphibalanus amphitrite TaxID=1232801 RepID=UPI001C910EEC|nr:ankyrin repeat domain-containing protein 23-like [Amphibalanus amphitrite]XP_043192373.1 ankyrin repeat domain-containing protein 23-like [Amphibalanus amphitrite]
MSAAQPLPPAAPPRPGPCDLRLAICSQDVRAVQALLAAGADPSLAHRHRTPLSWALQAGRAEIVAALLSAGADANGRSSDALERVEPPLITAIRLGQEASFAALLTAGAELDGEDFYGHTPLWTAVWHRQLSMAFQLVAAGAPVAADSWQQCPLYLSARQPCAGWRRLALLVTLLGASVSLRDGERRSALWWAFHWGDQRLARALLARGARLPEGCPPLEEVPAEFLRQISGPRSPPPLLELCRARVRALVGVTGRRLPCRLSRLPLPDVLIAYLQMKEFSEEATAAERWEG